MTKAMGRARRQGIAATIVVATVVLFGSSMVGAKASAGTLVPAQGGLAWGNNQTGELADGTLTGRTAPVRSIGLSGVQTISPGLAHCLALRSNGTVLAWGHNRSGEFGNGTTSDSSKPVPVTGLSGVRRVSAGGSSSLALKSNGAVLAWGNNASGELGNGKAPTDSAKPVAVRGLGPGSGVVAISAGGSFGLALKSNGAVLAWGQNASGELGNGKAPTDSAVPVAVKGLGPGSGVVAISAGGAFGLALKSNGAVVSWGHNASGELGDGKATDSATPVAVKGLGPGSGVVAISAGGAFALALRSDGTVLAWGNNSAGELGNGTAPNDHHTPVHVSGLTGVRQVSAGWAHALALKSGGAVYAWGDNLLGQLGDGSTKPAARPIRIRGFGGHRVLGVYAGGNHSHALVGAVVAAPSPKPSPQPSPRAPPTPSPKVAPTPAPGHKSSKGQGSNTKASHHRPHPSPTPAKSTVPSSPAGASAGVHGSSPVAQASSSDTTGSHSPAPWIVLVIALVLTAGLVLWSLRAEDGGPLGKLGRSLGALARKKP
jgi:alpha-tubulin suppressor-like RCC1 family protein